MIYTTFAQLYDQLMDPIVYEDWIKYFQQQVAVDANAKVLDLGCGSGALTLLLKQAGYQLEGLDLSEEMLSLASARFGEADVFIPLYQGDMMDLSELGEYQTIFSSLDSLCYLADQTEVGTVFQQVAQHLPTGGQFLFDVHSTYQIDQVFPDYMYNYQNEDQAFLWHSYPTDVEHGIEHELTFFVKNQAGTGFERLSEHHYERTYPAKVYLELLKKAGFTQVDLTAGLADSPLTEQTTRWFFSCRK
ncbi:methyltransferase [Ligilactobacillus pabuli]|uniref:Methyltransferase n=2 Tax=Ligilactobacillus pabuli TaxID=2886039 RepID=A0ABQ5JGH2_9LACO|nr:methyltransferase [Ligilactobacillus pabuli]